MNFFDDDVSILTELGVTATQAKIYLTLAKTNNLTAQEISTTAKISRPDVYRILTRLEKAGIVEKIIANPTEFRAIPINLCITALMEKRIQKTAQIAQKAKILVQNFKPNNINKDKEKSQFILLPEKPSIHDKAQQMLQNAQNCICLLMEPRIIFPWLTIYLPIFKRALDRNVDCRLITPQFATNDYLKTLQTLMKYPNFKLRFISEMPKAVFSLWDKKAVLIVTSPVGTQDQTPTLWSNNKSIVDLCQDYFETLWVSAKTNAISLNMVYDVCSNPK